MKYILTIILSFIFYASYAIDNDTYNSIDGRILKYGRTYTETRNTSELSDSWFDSNLGVKVWQCSFTVTEKTDVLISLCGSEVEDTYLTLKDNNSQVIADCDDILDGSDLQFGYQPCSNGYQSEVTRTLSPGTYTVFSRGYDTDGGITLSITTKRNNTLGVNGMNNPIDLGFLDDISQLSQTKSTSDYQDTYGACKFSSGIAYTSRDYGAGAGDIVYKFQLKKPLNLKMYRSDSNANAWIELLDGEKNRISDGTIEQIYDPEVECYHNKSLTKIFNPGTYFLVSTTLNNMEGPVTMTIEQVIEKPTVIAEPTILIPAFSTGENYVVSSTMTKAVTGTVSLNSDNSNTTIQYFDGLGRSIETIQKGMTPLGKDLGSLTEYDAIGREYKHWLPTPASGSAGEYISPATMISNTNSFYTAITGDGKPFTETILEASPLNRILGQRNPGVDFNYRPICISYQTNFSGQVAYYYVENYQLKRSSTYNENSLYVTETTDEDGKRAFDYKDKQGKVIMKKKSTNVNTYYVYNDLGQLAYVLPPLASDGMGANTTYSDNHDMLIKYGYIYKYDEHGNNVVKRLPGCDSICMVYDKANRLICSQDGNQRLKNKWTVNKYDQLGRVIYTGVMTNTKKRIELKAIISTLVITESFDVSNISFYSTGYTCTAAPTVLTGIVPLTVNYYDSYSFVNLQSSESDKSNLIFLNSDGYDNKYTISKGLLTGTRTYILDKTASNLTTAIYYDDRGRVVQTRSNNHLGGYDYTYNQYDFTGKLRMTKHTHNSQTLAAIDEITRNDYDNAGRLIKTRYKIGSADTITIAQYTYDELGRPIQKLRHNGTDNEQFAYNIRNWTTRINSGAFEENLNYTYNGNIYFQTWTYNDIINHYSYEYDDLNRLSDASNEDLDAHTDHGESIIEYDKQGNMTTVSRYLGTPYAMDMLNLTYNGNQLKKVIDWDQCQSFYSLKDYMDGVDVDIEFNYDKNGNMTTDLDRNIASIRYNILNLPDTIQFFTGNQIINRYAADGRKLGTEYFTRVTGLAAPIIAGQVINQSYLPGAVKQDGTAYIDNKEYNTLNGNWTLTTLSRVHNPEGYYSYNTSPYTGFIYTRKDHLGSIREVWHAESNKTIQRTQYYPSGLAWETTSDDNLSTQPYKYNGKEFVEMHGYNGLDYGARTYFADRNGWGSVDPLAENHYDLSPYAYCMNNPINNIDPLGLDTVNINSKTPIKKGDVMVDGKNVVGTASINQTEVTPQKSDPDSHFGLDNSYNLYTPNENEKVFKFYMNVALSFLLGPAVESLGLGGITASVGSKAANVALKAAIKAPAATNALKNLGGSAMIFLAQKTFQATAGAAVAGAVEGTVKSIYGPDPESSSSMFMNPASNFGMNAAQGIWNGWTVLKGSNPLPNP